MDKSISNKCQCCGSHNIKLVFNNSFFNLPTFRCIECSVHFVNYFGNENRIKEYYSDTYWRVFRNIQNEKELQDKMDAGYRLKKFPKIIKSIIEKTGVRKSLARSQYNYVRPYVKGRDLFEIGAGEGFVLELFEKNDFCVYGIEPSTSNMRIINDKLRTGKCDVGFVEDVTFIDKKFDVIIISHVLEHLMSCRDTLAILKNKLKKNGILFIEVPNCSNETNLKESVNTQPHLYHFTRESLQKLVEIEGYEILRSDTFISRIVSWKDHINYLFYWILNKDCYLPASEMDGNRLRMIITNRTN